MKLRTTVPLYEASGGLALLMDQYALTMGQGFYRAGVHNRRAVFNLFFRKHPFAGGGYSVFGGLAELHDWLSRLKFTKDDLDYVASLREPSGAPTFQSGFLDLLRDFRFEGNLDAMLEGTVIFPHQPLIRGEAPVWQLPLIEAATLLFTNRASSVMTRVARIVDIAKGDPIWDQSLRRGPGIDGVLSDALHAYMAGAAGTSNMLAGRHFGIPTGGTMAHAFVMFFDTEEESFERFGEAFPEHALFLVDTYNTLRGVEAAIRVGRRLRERGRALFGIRIDSGDLAALSIKARRMLDDAGFTTARIFGSNGLDEHLIQSIKAQGGQFAVWGVGDAIAGSPSLGSVWKLSAAEREDGTMRRIAKVSATLAKSTTPGSLAVKRYFDPDTGALLGDLTYDINDGVDGDGWIRSPLDPYAATRIPETAVSEDLLVPIFRAGQSVFTVQTVDEVRSRVAEQLSRLGSAHRRLVNADHYPAGITSSLWRERDSQIKKAIGMPD